MTSKTSYFLNTRIITSATVSNIYNRNDESASVIRLVCAYL